MNFIADRGSVYWGTVGTDQLLATALPHELAAELVAALDALYTLGYFNQLLPNRDGVLTEAKRIITACGQVAWHRSRLAFADRNKRAIDSADDEPMPENIAKRIARGLAGDVESLALEMLTDGKLQDGWSILVQWEIGGKRPGHSITPIAP